MTDIIPKIENGTVIDHIPSQNTMKIAEILSNKFKGEVTIGINFKSKRLGLKGIIKLEDVTLSEKDVSKIAILARKGTLNIVRNGKVIKKTPLNLPLEVEEILKCPNSNCITNFQKAKTLFKVIRADPMAIRCIFCERAFGFEELIFS